jgi:hypothetical protein
MRRTVTIPNMNQWKIQRTTVKVGGMPSQAMLSFSVGNHFDVKWLFFYAGFYVGCVGKVATFA